MMIEKPDERKNLKSTTIKIEQYVAVAGAAWPATAWREVCSMAIHCQQKHVQYA